MAASADDEFTEEWLQGVIDSFMRNSVLGEENDINPFTWDKIYQGLIGAVMGGATNVPSAISTPALDSVIGTETMDAIKAADAGRAMGTVQEEVKAIGEAPIEMPESVQVPEPDSFANISDYENQAVQENAPMMQEANVGSERLSVLESGVYSSRSNLTKRDAVASIEGNEIPQTGQKYSDRAMKFLETRDYKATNPEIGEVLFSKRGLKATVAKGLGPYKAMAFAAVPDVIEKGAIIDFVANWKGKGYDSFVIAAPVNIKDERHYIGVVVKRVSDGNRFYVHEVVDEKGHIVSFSTRSPASGVTSDTSAPSIVRLLQNIINVKREGESPTAIQGKAVREPETLSLFEIHNQIKNGDQSQLNRIYGEENKEKWIDENLLKYQKSKIPYSDSAAKVIPKEIKQGIDIAIKKIEKDFPGLTESIRSIKLNEQLEEAAQIRMIISGDGTVTRGLELNPVMWSSRERLAAEYKKILDKKTHAPSDDPYSIIVHEMGHVIHQNVALRKTSYFLSGKLSREQISIFNFEMKKTTQECYAAAFTNETYDEIINILTKALGSVAADYPEEFIADCFSSVYTMKKSSNHARKVVQCLMKRGVY